MKKKKGFTLIELLAVIVILAVIALIAVPVILNIIDKANKSAFKDTAYGVISAAELYFSEQQLDVAGMQNDVEFNLPEDANTAEGLQLKGKVPTGIVKVTKEGKVSIAVQNRRYCIIKGLEETEVTITEDAVNCFIPVPITDMTLTSASEISLTVGETSDIETTIEPNEATNKKLNYTLDKENVVTVSETGLITAVNPGSVIITVSTTDGSNISRTVSVTVKQPVEGLDLGITTLTLNTNQTYQIEPTITPDNAENKTLTYASSKTSVATVTENGLITAVGTGSATITVTTTDGTGISKTISVTVKQLAESINLDRESVTIGIGKGLDEKVAATVLPSNASSKGLTWTSADPAIATVSNGTITGVSLGTTTITATTKDGTNISKTISVTVSETYTNGIMQSVNNCINEGTCPNGTTVKVAVNDQQSYKFYTIKDTEDTLTLIMSQNLGNKVVWIDGIDYTRENNKDEIPDTCGSTSCNDEGPITAINYLDGLTDEEWSNIPKRDYIYSGLDDKGNRKYEDITRTMRARMITYGEATTLGCTTSSGNCPSWLYGGSSYWTSTANASYSSGAWSIGSGGSMNSDNVTNGGNGIRPVIELSK